MDLDTAVASPSAIECLQRWQILDDLQKDYRRAKILRHGATWSVVFVGGGLVGGSLFLGAPVEMAVGAGAMALFSAAGLQVTSPTERSILACHIWLRTSGPPFNRWYR